MDKEQYLSFLNGDTWLSQLARFNVVYGDKPHSSIANQIKNSFNYKTFTENQSAYKHLDDPFRNLASSIFKKEYYNYGKDIDPDTGYVDYGTKVLRDALDFSTASSFDDELSEGFISSNRVLKKIFGSTFSTDLLGLEQSQFDHARSSLFGAVFNRVEQSFGTASTPLVNNEGNNSAMYIPALEKQLTELASYDLINSMDQYNRVNLDLDNLNRETAIQEAMRSLGTGYLESMDSKRTLPTNVLDKFRYINKPGILPVVDMIHRAKGEITIDIYQLQNPVIRGYILGKITNAAINKEELNVSIRMASSVEPSASSIAYGILGPNLLMAKELSMLNSQLGSDSTVNIDFKWSGRRNHTKLLMTDKGALVGTANFTEPVGDSIFQAGFAFETIRQIRNNINDPNVIEYFDLIAKNNLIERDLSFNYSSEQLRDIGYKQGEFDQVINDLADLNLDLDSESYLYLQSRYLNEYIRRGIKLPNRLGTLNNIKDRPVGLGTAGDTYDLLKKSLQTVIDASGPTKSNRMFFGFLNQTFLLDLKPITFDISKIIDTKDPKTSLIRGEMGDESPETLRDEQFKNYIFEKQRVYQTEIQIPLFEAIINNKAKVIVHSHEYEERILGPVYKELLKDTRFTKEADYDLNRYVENLFRQSGQSELKTVNQKVTALSRSMAIGNSELATTVGASRIRSIAYQLLAITSGNIEKAIVPFSHAKTFGTVEFQNEFNDLNRDIRNATTNDLITSAIESGHVRLLTGKMGSSNMGLYSLDVGADLTEAYRDLDQRYTNSELDLLLDFTKYAREKSGNKYGYLDEEKDFLKMLAQSMSALVNKTRLTSGLIYTDVDPREQYQKNIDRGRVEQLFSSLDKLSEDSKVGDTKLFKVSRVIDNSGIKELIVSIEGLKGPKSYRFTVLKDSVANSGLYSVLAIDQGRIINRIAFANTSGMDINIGLEALDGSINNDGTTIMKGRRVFLDPMQSTISLISSLVLEKQQLQYIKNPLDFIKEVGSFEDYLSDSQTKVTRLVNIFLAQIFSVDLNIGEGGEIDLSASLKKLSHSPRRAEMQQLAKRNIERFLFEYGDEKGRSKSRASYIRTLAGLGEDSITRDTYARYGALLKEFLDFTKKSPTGVNFADSDIYTSLINTTRVLLSDANNIDFIEFFVKAVGGNEVTRRLNLRLQAVDRKLFETFLTPTQQRVYSATQSYDQMPLYGVSKQNEYAAEIINRAKGRGTNELVRRALMHLPFSFGPADYLGTGFTSFVKVAEGSGAKLGRSGRAYGNVNVLDFIEEGEAKTGTIYDMAIINEARVGAMVRKEDLQTYLKELEEAGVTKDSLTSHIKEELESKEELLKEGKAFLIFNFAKLSQTSQRLKNTLGARPLMTISARYSAFLDEAYKQFVKDASLAKSKSDRSYAVFKELVVNSYLDSLVGTDTKLKNKILKVEGERIDYAAMFSGSINTILGPRALNLVREVEEEVNNEYSNVDEGIRREIIRIRLVNNELRGITKGLIGSELISSGNRERASVLLVALGGAYSDFAYSNPLYRYSNTRKVLLESDEARKAASGAKDLYEESIQLKWKGPRTAFLDQATKSIKASLLSIDLDLIKNSEGGVFYTFDSDLNSVLKQGERAFFDFETGLAVIADNNGGHRTINSRAELNVIKGAIYRSGNRIPTAGVVTAASSVPSAMGESGIEYMFSTNFMEGSIYGNEIRKQIQYIRSQISSNRRLDSTGGGLFKAPIGALSGEYWARVISKQLNINITDGISNVGDGWDLDISQIFALGSMSNIKSYLLEHGSNLLTTERESFINLLTSKTKSLTTVASAILLAFNDDFLDQGINKKNLYQTLFQNIQRGEMGRRFQAMAYVYEYKTKFENNLGYYRGFFSQFRAENKFNNLTTMRLNNPLIRNIFESISKNNFTVSIDAVNAIKQMLSIDDSGNEIYLGRGKNLNYLSNRERAIIASQLDIVYQLIEPKQLSNIPLMPRFSGTKGLSSERDYAFQVVKGLMGFSDEEATEYMETYMDVLSNNHAVLRLYVGATPSQSKVSASKKATANIELQELIERNFLASASTFDKGNRVDNIRKHVAEIYALMTGSSRTVFQNAYTGEILDLITLDVIGAKDKAPLASNLMVKALSQHKNPNFKTDLFNLVKGYSIFAYLNDEQIRRIASNITKYNQIRKVIASDLDLDKAGSAIEAIFQQKVGKEASQKYASDKVVRAELFKAVVIAERTAKGTHYGEAIIKHMKGKMFETINNIRAENIPYLLDPNESYLSKAENIVSELIRNQFTSGSIMFPSFTATRGRGDSLGYIKVKADFNNLNYGIILGPKAIRALGEQFGGFQSELAASALSLYKALDPDSVVFQALNKFREVYSYKVGKNLNLDTLEVDLTQQQAQALISYQDEVKNFYDLAAKELSGRYVQEIMGNRVRAKGGTLVGIASFYVGQREAVVPDIFNTKFDVIGDKDPRMAMARQIAAQSGNPIDFSDTYISNDLVRKLNNSAINALIDGMSNKTAVVEFISSQSKTIRNQILNSLNIEYQLGESEFKTRSGNLQEKLDHFKTYIDYLDYGGKGDAYLKYLAKAEYHYLDALFKKHHYHHSIKIDKDFAAIGEREKAIRTLNKLDQVKGLTIFHGFLGTESSRPQTNSDRDKLIPSQLEGKLGGIGLDNKTDVNLKVFGKSAIELSNYLDSLKASANSASERLLSALSDSLKPDERQRVTATQNRFIERLEANIKTLSTMPPQARVNQSIINNIKLDIVEYISNSNAGEYNFKRSPPPGYLQLSSTGNIQVININDLNNRINKDYSFDSNQNIPFFADNQINKNLGIFNPISYLAPNLGDFDGDTMSGVMLSLTELEIEKANLISKNVNSTTSFFAKAIKQSNYSPDAIVLYSKKVRDSQKKGLNKKIADNQERIKQIDSLIDEYKKINGYKEFETNLKTWVANYTKLGKEVIDSFTTGEILTFVTQTKGLFPNLENAYSKNKNIIQSLDKDYEKLGKPLGTDLSNKLQAINLDSASPNLLATIYSYLSKEEKVELAKLNNRDRVRAFFGAKIAENANITEAVNKFSTLSVGQGISEIDMDLFNSMLGKAGSYLLGQTYNNTIGMLYEKSPLLAIASSLDNSNMSNSFEELMLKDDDLRKRMFDLYAVNETDRLKISSTAGDNISVKRAEAQDLLRRMKETASSVKAGVDTLGALIQNIHQLMRDSIKLKSETKGVEYIGELVERYKGADTEEARTAIIAELSKGLAVKPLYYLDELMKGLSDMNVELNPDFSAKKAEAPDLEEKLNEVDQSTKNALDKIKTVFDFSTDDLDQRLQRLTSRLNDSSLTEYAKKIEGDTTIKLGGLLATYETKNAILGMITEFAVENISYENNRTITGKIGKSIRSGVGNYNLTLATNTPDSIYRKLSEDKVNSLQALANVDLSTDSVDSVTSLEQKEFIEFLTGKDNLKLQELFDSSNVETSDDLAAKAKRTLIAEQFMYSREAVNKTFGVFGEKMIALQAINSTRKRIPSAEATDLEQFTMMKEDAEITQSIFQNLQTGKIDDPASMSAVFRTLVSLYAGQTDVDSNQVLRKTLDLVTQNPKGNFNSEEQHFYTIISEMLKADERNNGNLGNDILDTARATDLGQKAETISQILGYFTSNNQTQEMVNTNAKHISDYQKNTVKGILAHYVGNDVASTLDTHPEFKFNYGYFLQDNNEFVQEFLKNSIQNSVDNKVRKDIEAFGYKVGTASSLAEIGLFPALSLIGGLMSAQSYGEGSTEALVEQTIGNSIMAFAYNQSSFSSLGQALTVGFKARIAARSGDDPLKSIATLVVQESIAAAIFAPKAELFQSIANGIDNLDDNGIAGVFKKSAQNTQKFFKGATSSIADIVNVPVSSAINLDLESYGKSALDYENNLYLKKATASTIYNIAAGGFVYSANSFLNWFTNRGNPDKEMAAQAMEERVGTPSLEEKAIDNIVNQYTNATNNNVSTQLEEPSQPQMRNSDGSEISYNTEEYYDSNYYNQVSSYQELDAGYEIIAGQTQYLDYSVAV